MFTDNELKTSLDYVRRKKDNILNSKDGSDFDYIRDLQTLTQLENAFEEQQKKAKHVEKEFYLENIKNPTI